MLAQQIANAISLGGVYALFALGFTLIFGVLNVVNLAHGAIFMLGAYAALKAVVVLQLPLPAAIVVAMLLTGAAGWLLDKSIFAPLRARRRGGYVPAGSRNSAAGVQDQGRVCTQTRTRPR